MDWHKVYIQESCVCSALLPHDYTRAAKRLRHTQTHISSRIKPTSLEQQDRLHSMSFFRFDPIFSTPFLRVLDTDLDEGDDEKKVATQPKTNTPEAYPRQTWTPDFFRGPRLDVVEHPDKFSISAEVPGIKSEDVHLNVDEKLHKITISGSVKSEYHSDSAATNTKEPNATTTATGNGQNANKAGPPRTLVSERMFGTFDRSVKLPASADLSAIKASMNTGILKVDIPKHEEKRKPALRRVEIEDVRDEADK